MFRRSAGPIHRSSGSRPLPKELLPPMPDERIRVPRVIRLAPAALLGAAVSAEIGGSLESLFPDPVGAVGQAEMLLGVAALGAAGTVEAAKWTGVQAVRQGKYLLGRFAHARYARLERQQGGLGEIGALPVNEMSADSASDVLTELSQDPCASSNPKLPDVAPPRFHRRLHDGIID